MSWKCRLEIKTREMKLLVLKDSGGDLLKARLIGMPNHPRALLTMLEGLALWQGKPIHCVVFAAGPVDHSLGLDIFGDDLWPDESALVHFEWAEPRSRRRRIQLRLVEGEGP